MEMHDCNDQNHVPSNLVEDAVGESIRSAPARALRQRSPCGRILDDASDCPVHLHRELESKPLAFVVVIGNGVDEFRFGRLEKFESHQKSPRSILAKTSAAGLDSSSPLS